MRYRTNGEAGVPMVIRAPCGGGIHGALYHSQSIEVFYAHVPGLKVVMPSTPADAAGHAPHRDRATPIPVLFLEHKKCYRLVKGEVPDGRYITPLGTRVDRGARAPTSRVITYGYELHRCLEAAERLAADEGIQAEVVDVRTLAPLDTETILRLGAPHLARRWSSTRTTAPTAPAPRSWPRSPRRRCSTSTRPLVRIGGPDIPAMPYAAALEHVFMEPEPDHIYRAMRDLAAF